VGKERWSTEICDQKEHYFASPTPIVVGNHILVGVGGDDLDIPGYLESRDRAGIGNWPNEEAMSHGGGMTSMSGTYDPELNLYYFGTGNPQPVMAGKGRAGDDLYTE
jgi:hypothetical protein